MEALDKPNLQNFFIYIFILILVIIGAVFLFSRENTSKDSLLRDESTSSSQIKPAKYKAPPDMMVDTKKKYKAELVTNNGKMTIELFVNETPTTVNNFVFLAKEGFYNGTVFHRIIRDFMIQGGDPKGDGTGGPGYTFPDEKITRDYRRGIVAMANSGPNTNSSQFFIMHKDTNLPKNYVIFGQVVGGIEIVDKIAEVPTVDNGLGEKSKPVETVKIERIDIKEE